MHHQTALTVTVKTYTNYIDENGNITPKYLYQIQLQMTNRRKAIFVVASPDFEKNKEIVFKDYDSHLVDNILQEIRVLGKMNIS